MAAVQHTFGGNPLLLEKREVRQPKEVEALLATVNQGRFLPVSDGKPLIKAKNLKGTVSWELAWQTAEVAFRSLGGLKSSEDLSSLEGLVYLGELQGQPFYSFNLPKSDASGVSIQKKGDDTGYIDLRTLMVATPFSYQWRKEDLAIAGYARALLGWHAINQFCGKCGTKTESIQFGLRRVCSLGTCKLKLYPRIDPVVIMCVIAKDRDVILLGRGARHPANMYSCLAGFIEPGESLEEAVRRETREEVGIVIGEVVHHSSQPWPVGYGTQQCQLMVGFFAHATTSDIKVDRNELADARWFTREEVRASFSEGVYAAARADAQQKIADVCFRAAAEGEAKLSDIQGRGEPSAMFVPNAYAIAHHLILAWLDTERGALRRKV